MLKVLRLSWSMAIRGVSEQMAKAFAAGRSRLVTLPGSGSMRALREGLVCVVPAFIVASLFLAAASTLRLFNGPTSVIDSLTSIHDGVTDLLPFMIAASIGFMTSIHHSVPRVPGALVSVACVRIALTVLANADPPGDRTMAPVLSMVLPLLCVPVMARLFRKPWTKLSRSHVAEESVMDAVNLVIPGVGAALLAVAIAWVIRIVGAYAWLGGWAESVEPDQAFLVGSAICAANSLLWLAGIHGYHAIAPAFETMDQAVALNAVSVAAGNAPDHIINGSFLGSFVFIGGSGGTAALVVAILLFGRHNTLRTLAWASVPLALLNINEPLLFGIPIVFSLRLGIPFLLVPLVNLATAALATKAGLIAAATVAVPLNSPVGVNSFIATGGQWSAPLFQLLLVGVGALIYAPFVRRMEIDRDALKVINLRALDTTFSRLKDDGTIRSEDPMLAAREAVKLQHAQVRAIERISSFEYFLEYQPQVSAFTGRCLGAEALVRALDADGKRCYPPEFLPWLEGAGLHFELDRWVAKATAEQDRKWMEAGVPQCVTVNLSGRTMSDVVAASDIAEILAPSQGRISIEITEHVLVDNGPTVRRAIDRFHEVGSKVYVDDFGCGYSSLSYLHDFDVDTVKIDRSFVLALDSTKGQKVLEGIFRFTDVLGLAVVVEGVETREQLDTVIALIPERTRDVGIQGWYFAKAMSADDFIRFADESRHIVLS